MDKPFPLYQGQRLRIREPGFERDNYSVEIGPQCIRESSSDFGKWNVLIANNFSGWLTEDQIFEQFELAEEKGE